MQATTLTKALMTCVATSALLTTYGFAQGVHGKPLQKERVAADAASSSPIQVPNRPANALFQGEQGKQNTEIFFDAATQIVTAKMLVQDPNGYFIPNIRRDNFAVYENGVRQQNATVEVEHAPVSLAVLMEWGGRYQALNKALAEEVPRAAHQLLDELGRQDKIALFRYGDRLDRLADFSSGHETLDGLLTAPNRPEFSELNFYDALKATLESIKSVNGRKAVILISSGIDTFSKAHYDDALALARDSGTPIYVLNIGPRLRDSAGYSSNTEPYARLDWKRAEKDLQEIAKASGGRLYSPQWTFNLSGVYDDIMENLRVRYVITYRSTNNGDLNAARTVRVELVDSRTGGPLEIVDTNRKTVRSRVFVEDSYIPNAASRLGLDGPISRTSNNNSINPVTVESNHAYTR